VLRPGTPHNMKRGRKHTTKILPARTVELKRAKQDHIEADARFRLLMESTAEAVIVVDTRTGRITDCNQKAADLLGREAANLIGLRQIDIHPPQDKDPCLQRFRQVVASKDIFKFECVFRRGDGQDLWAGVRARTYRAGGRKYVLAVLDDITDRKRAEEAMRGHKARFLNLLEHVPGIAIQGYATDGTVRYWNKASEMAYGYTAQEAVGRDLGDLIIPPEIKPLYRQALQMGAKATRSGQLMPPAECLLLRKDGTRIPVFSIHTVVCLDGQEPEMFCIDMDLSERKAAEDRLRQAQKLEAIGKLAGGIAHDFNNQLTVVKGYCDILLQDLPADSPIREPIEQILKAAKRSASMTGQLLAYSREQVLRPEIINLNHILTDMAVSLRHLLGEKIELSLDLDGDLGDVPADLAAVQQAITNITINARDAMPRGGGLTIQTRNGLLDATYTQEHPDASPGPHVMMTFHDNGFGMDEQTLQRIFDPFFTTKPLGQGTGLGLSMVYGFVKQSGGHIEVASRPGAGSTFRIFLPRQQGTEAGGA